MTKKDLIKTITMDSHLSAAEAATAVDVVLAGINTLAATGPLQLRGFGTFEVITKPAREVFNPREQKKVMSVEKRVMKFKPPTPVPPVKQ
jgi:DNA-binding protein HU-beta